MVKDNLQEQIKDALKKQDGVRVSTLRLLLSALNNAQIAKQAELISEDEMTVIKRQVKQREEAIEAYTNGGRHEAAEKERAELAILKEFMPEQMTPEDLENIVLEVMGEMKSQDFGKVMQAVMQKVKGKADGKMVSEIVKAKIMPANVN